MEIMNGRTFSTFPRITRKGEETMNRGPESRHADVPENARRSIEEPPALPQNAAMEAPSFCCGERGFNPFDTKGHTS